MARIIAFYGPKHGILFASLLRILSLVSFALVPFAGPHALLAIAGFGFFQQLSASAYEIGYLTDFSKVKHRRHAGKEIGTMQMIEKAARVASPLAGGLIASVWSPQATIILAALLFLVSVVPLFATVEPTATRSRLRISGFPWRLALPSLAAQTAVGADFVVSGMVWTLFITVFIFAGLDSAIYLAIGGLASLGVLTSAVAAWAFGQLVDKHKGGVLLTLGVFANAITHCFRPFISTAPGVMGVGIVNESATSAYTLPLTRVLFDVADSSGFRITYLMFAEMCLAFGAALVSVLLYVALQVLPAKEAFVALFAFGAVYELVLLVCRRAAR